ncbi:MAG: hypothetical protein AAF989_08400 [Planctomycetota bacterium]
MSLGSENAYARKLLLSVVSAFVIATTPISSLAQAPKLPKGFDPAKFEVVRAIEEGDRVYRDGKRIRKAFDRLMGRYKKVCAAHERRVLIYGQTVFQDLSVADAKLVHADYFLAEDPFGDYMHLARAQEGAEAPPKENARLPTGKKSTVERRRGLTLKSGSFMMYGGDGRAFIWDQGEVLASRSTVAAYFGFLQPHFLPCVDAASILLKVARESQVVALIDKTPDEIVEFSDGSVRILYRNGALRRCLHLDGKHKLPVLCEVYFSGEPPPEVKEPSLKYVVSRTRTKWNTDSDHPHVANVDMVWHNAGNLVWKGNTLKTSFSFVLLDPDIDGYERFFDRDAFGFLIPPIKTEAPADEE